MSENVVKLENNFNQAIERKIAVIFVTDVVGFSKLMEINENQWKLAGSMEFNGSQWSRRVSINFH